VIAQARRSKLAGGASIASIDTLGATCALGGRAPRPWLATTPSAACAGAGPAIARTPSAIAVGLAGFPLNLTQRGVHGCAQLLVDVQLSMTAVTRAPVTGVTSGAAPTPRRPRPGTAGSDRPTARCRR